LTLNAQVSGTAKVTPKKMIYVEGGTFQMGSTNGGSSEQPIHTVTVSSFLIGKYEVTQKEWQEVMGYNPSYSEGDNRPVESITWYDAVEFCNKLSEKEGLTPAYTINGFDVSCNWSANGYRLPTEAEWEYAAKGGKKSKNYKYSGSDNIDDVAWYDANSDGRSHDVGTKAPNELGIYDMSGNVWEWCWDWYGSYSSSPSSNPRGPNSGSSRVDRGGSWSYYDGSCRVAYRNYRSPGDSLDVFGFRIVRTSE
jgi:formylglycine-generating enzyme required for sulfatase activity